MAYISNFTHERTWNDHRFITSMTANTTTVMWFMGVKGYSFPLSNDPECVFPNKGPIRVTGYCDRDSIPYLNSVPVDTQGSSSESNEGRFTRCYSTTGTLLYQENQVYRSYNCFFFKSLMLLKPSSCRQKTCNFQSRRLSWLPLDKTQVKLMLKGPGPTQEAWN